jgi:hypothetical protein
MIVYVVNENSSYISSEFDILEAGQVLYKWRKNFMKKIMKSFLVALAVLMVLAVPVDVDAASIKLNKKKMTIYVGQSVTLKVKGAKKKKVKWKSSKKKIAKVTNKGKVTGCKVGKATITAKVGKKSLKCKVTVKKFPQAKASNIKVKKIAFTQRGDLVARVTNNNKIYACVNNIKAIFKNKNGAPIHTEKTYEIGIGAGASKLIMFDTSYSNAKDAASVSFIVSMEPTYAYSFYTEYNYDMKATRNSNNVGLTFRNTSKVKIGNIKFLSVLYRNNKVVGATEGYFYETIKPGATAYFTIDHDYDEYGDTVDFDRGELYLISAQSY